MGLKGEGYSTPQYPVPMCIMDNEKSSCTWVQACKYAYE